MVSVQPLEVLQTTERKTPVDNFAADTKGYELVELQSTCNQTPTPIWPRTQCPAQHSHILENHCIFPREALCLICWLCGACCPAPSPDNQQGSGASIQLPGDSGDRWLQDSQGLSGTVTQTSCHYANITINHFIINTGQLRAHWALPLAVAALQELALSRDNSQGYPQGWMVPYHNRSLGSDQ